MLLCTIIANDLLEVVFPATLYMRESSLPWVEQVTTPGVPTQEGWLLLRLAWLA